jgi:ATP-dependent DNA ligase
MLPVCQPLSVIAKAHPFDGAEWLFELKYDGFRALAYLENGRCRLVSRNGHAFSSFDSLASSLTKIPHDGGLILDGELACVDAKGRPRFNDLLFRRREPCFFAFDLLHMNGNDCRRDSLAQRKLALRQLLNSANFSGAIYVDHVEAEGTAIYSRANLTLKASLPSTRTRRIFRKPRSARGTRSGIRATPKRSAGMSCSSANVAMSQSRASTDAT